MALHLQQTYKAVIAGSWASQSFIIGDSGTASVGMLSLIYFDPLW
mgnify:CR=1 FL=1